MGSPGGLLLLVLAPWLCGAANGFEPPVATPAAEAIRARVSTTHPRLLLTAPGLDRLKAALGDGTVPATWKEAVLRGADALTDAPVSRYEIPDGLRLLSTSRRVLDRTFTLGLAFRLERNPQHAERLWRELSAAAAFPDWNARHFLDTAEMTHAFAIGYDWLYDRWTPAQRAILRQAMVEKGLRLGVECHQGSGRFGRWPRAEHNWNQVCNGGVGMGALALATEEPALAGEFLEAALRSIQRALRHYGPDGAWAEGPGYWNYATAYSVYFLAALQTACGTDFGLSGIPGFAEAGLFPLYVTGPLGKTFNYADGGDGTIRAPAMFWLANRFQAPALAAYQRRHARPDPMDLVWGAWVQGSDTPPLALHRYFRGAEVVTMRSGWDNTNASFVAFKAGDNKANHSHLDLGSFVFDALGVRWVVDPGADDYNLPGYFGGQRWTYYRLRAEGHNVLVLNPGDGPDQDPKAAGRILRFGDGKGSCPAFAVADVTGAYAGLAKRVQRGVRLAPEGLWLQDEVEADPATDAWWFLHTRADARLESAGRAVLLSSGTVRCAVRLLSPAEARFEVRPAAPLPSSPRPAQQAVNKGMHKLVVHLPGVSRFTVAVQLVPLSPGASVPEAPLAIEPLNNW